MHVSLQVMLVAAVMAAAWGAPAAAPGGRLARVKQPRATRGFKNTEMMTARGFGKRNYHPTRTDLYGLDNLWDVLEQGDKGQLEQTDDKATDSVPAEWFVDEMVNNPEFAKTVVHKFLDIDQDGNLSSEELLRTPY